MKKFTVTDELEVFQMISPWKYISIPFEYIKGLKTGGWGSIPVYVTIGNTKWKTSMFPMKKEKYFLPVKKAVCKSERLTIGEKVTVMIDVI